METTARREKRTRSPENRISAKVVEPLTWALYELGRRALSVPVYWTTERILIGSHFAGRLGDEATLFRLAGQLERCRPWLECGPSPWAPRRAVQAPRHSHPRSST